MRYHCLRCNEDNVHVHAGDGYHFGCSGRAIPIATICDPPEPTVIEASDLAPGMVCVVVDEFGVLIADAWLCDPQTCMTEDGFSYSRRFFHMEDGDFTVDQVRRIAGKGRP